VAKKKSRAASADAFDGLLRTGDSPPPAPSAAQQGAPAPQAAPAQQQAYPEAEAERTRTASDAASLLTLARSVRDERGCAAASSYYERAARAGGDLRSAGVALLELAECQRSLGQLPLARQTLERATENAAVAAMARKRLASETKSAVQAAPVEAAPRPAAEAVESE
jgi:hypothetical protein